MLIVLGLYFGLVWLLFAKLKILPWNGFWKGTVYTIAVMIALVVIGALNHTTPSGPISVQGTVTSIAPNVAGRVIDVPVEANTVVAEGDVLFRLDDTTQAAEVARLRATLVTAEASADQLKTDLEAAESEIAALEAQLSFGVARRDDIIELNERGASTEFQLQEAVSTIDQLEANMRAAEARKRSLELRIAAEIDGVDAGVAEVQQALAQAEWALSETVVRAPADGIVTGVSLRPGNRATTMHGAINFLIPGDRQLVATLPQSSLTNVFVGDTIRVALGTLPGTSFEVPIAALPPSTGEGVIDARSGLPSLRELAGTDRYVVLMDLPNDLPEQALRLGASGTALVITEEAGAIAVLAEVLF
ncbi:HlyD family secretion protein [Lutimaribacter marinistellae]|uniref:HlyD family secretion protein n=1 Tax=Lutimaribacter marinistellae TaxID=1820329 RepID=A0ABV7TMK3_9RHOB